MNFVRVWLLGVIHPVRSLDELKGKPAPQWGLWAVLIRFVMTALIETLPLYLLGREPFAPSYLTFLATKNYYRAEVFFLPLFGAAIWLLMSALAHVVLRVAGKGSDMDRILNIVGLGMLIPMPVLWAWDITMIALNIFTIPVWALSHATVQLWEASIEAVVGFIRLFRLRILPAIMLALVINILFIGRASGKPRLTPLNYALADGCIYCIAGFGSGTNWLANLKANPNVEVHLAGTAVKGRAEIVTEREEAERIKARAAITALQLVDVPPPSA